MTVNNLNFPTKGEDGEQNSGFQGLEVGKMVARGSFFRGNRAALCPDCVGVKQIYTCVNIHKTKTKNS